MIFSIPKKKITAAILASAGLMILVFWSARQAAIAPVKNSGLDAALPPRAKEIIVTKVLDGDTVVIQGGDHVRLLGIDADEQGYPCYNAARQRLEELVLQKSVLLEADNNDVDRYGRLLRYVFLGDELINQKIISEGLAVARFYPENQKYKNVIVAAENKAAEGKIGCKWNGLAQTKNSTGSEENQNEAKDLKWEKLTGSQIIPVCDAKNYIGREVIIEGVVADVYQSQSQTVFLNFGKPYPDNCFAAVIFKSKLANFPESLESAYAGKTLRISGIIQDYQGKAEIILDSSEQAEIGKNI